MTKQNAKTTKETKPDATTMKATSSSNTTPTMETNRLTKRSANDINGDGGGPPDNNHHPTRKAHYLSCDEDTNQELSVQLILRTLQAAHRKTHITARIPMFRTHAVWFTATMNKWLLAATGRSDVLARPLRKRSRPNEVQACPRCGHDYCGRDDHQPIEDSMFLHAGEWPPPKPLICGTDITASGRRYCCECLNRFQPTSPIRWQPPRVARDMTESPTTLMTLDVRPTSPLGPGRWHEERHGRQPPSPDSGEDGSESPGRINTRPMMDDLIIEPLAVRPSTHAMRTAARGPEPRSVENHDILQWKIMDITTSTDTYIVHQTNCTSRTARGLARQVFDTFNHADCYAHRLQNDLPGTITVRGNNQYERLVVNMNAQIMPGRPSQTGTDSSERRERYFMQCLHQLEQHILQYYYGRDVRIAFPQRIGCGLAGGHWPTYRQIIRDFARRIKITHQQGDTVTVCCLSTATTTTETTSNASPAARTDTTAETRRDSQPRRANVRLTIRALVAAHAQSHRLIGIAVHGKHAERFSITMAMWLMAAVSSTSGKRDGQPTIRKF